MTQERTLSIIKPDATEIAAGTLDPVRGGRLIFNDQLNAAHGPVFSMLTRFQREWSAENNKWVDAVLKAAAERGWLDFDQALLESLLALDRVVKQQPLLEDQINQWA